jgi:hypothetical protein
VQAHLQHYAEPSTDPPAATSSVSGSTLLPLGPGTLTHNPAGVPIIVACTKADLIDEGSDLAPGASGMGGMVRGKGGEWEERTDGVMQVLRTICLKCALLSAFEYRIFTNCMHRRRRPILHYAQPSNAAGAAAVRAAYAVPPACALARGGVWCRGANARAQSVPIHT